MDEDKVVEILSWPTPKNASEVRIFHGLAQYYRKFIRNFNGICAPMMDTIKGGIKMKFVWTPIENKGFDTLKKEVATKPDARASSGVRAIMYHPKICLVLVFIFGYPFGSNRDSSSHSSTICFLH